MVAQIVVVGGVRRSSLISLSDYFDPMMRNAKKWPFPEYRGMANNSMIFDEQPASPSFDRFWSELQHSGTGEPGIFNRTAARTKRRSDQIIGTNPCGEIILRDQEFCNLSEAVLRPSDDLISALDKVKIAAMIGVLQSNKTNFPFLRSSWQKNSVDERLLGVSLTGEYDSYHLMNDQDLRVLKEMVHSTAKSFSKMLGIKTPVAMTCVKPSGTVSQLVNASSGAHPRYASHYIRRYRISEGDPLYQLILESGFETTKDYLSDRTQVLEFPVAAPRHAITKDQVTAEQQLDHYLTLQRSWTDHNTSITIYVRPDEWKNLGQKVYKNWNHIVAVSFLPADDADHHYELAPYEEINAAEYNKRLDKLPAIDYNRLPSFETEDTTEGEREYACVGNQCDLLL
jgi:ribonucleoside-diphosphate reductase alpha chain